MANSDESEIAATGDGDSSPDEDSDEDTLAL
jgi:hypothetical protein